MGSTPFHGWILEVMEAPTPVSALLHAGLLNAGPFLIIRFAFLFDILNYAPIVLFIMGALTAIYGALVFTTQSTVKTALAYSSIAHMGFTLMVCGLGVYAASLLHLVAHSFYKAHSFLSSGSLVEKVRIKPASQFSRKGNIGRILLGFSLATSLFVLVASLMGISFSTEYQLLIIGAIIFISTANLLIQAIDSSNSLRAIFKSLSAMVMVLVLFFSLERFMSFALGNQIPELSAPSYTLTLVSGVTLTIFICIILLQAFAPLIPKGNLIKHFGVHVRNGFYINTIFDRLINSPLNHNA
ncbi:MAG: proton-conducting transporter membrane subunit [Bacteroidia bacterium]